MSSQNTSRIDNTSQPDPTQKYELLSVLANQHCRFVVRYFRDASEDDASVEELSTTFVRENDGDEDQAALHLHHTALPKLSDVGVVDYDARSKTVRYHGHSELEDVLDSMDSESKRAAKVW